jgi:acyl-lipid omega-6 desaturase (Delta-12 desaturase)
VLRDHPQLAAIGRLTLLESVRCVRMVLWDEVRQRGISFRDMQAIVRRQVRDRS